MTPISQQDLVGQSAVVTGASSGIGRAIALALGEAGADVLVHARASAAAAAQVAAEVRAQGREAEVLLADLVEPASQQDLVERAWQWRNIDIWVNNAGADVITGEPAAWPFDKKLEHLWKVDVTATVNLSRLVGARMKSRGAGLILNMGWDQANHGMAGDSGEMFATIKGAIQAFSRSLARSLAPEVRVNCLAPGWIKTSWGENASQAWQDRAQSDALLGRWGTPEDVARVARFLSSADASFITGQVIQINGGLASS